jgi:Asp-tRNA(Asn)/Glu-tRNA(Gln) amidotransferase A subunit family amidase
VADYLTIAEAASALSSGTVSSTELVQRALLAADEHDAALGTFVTRYPESALEAAAAADRAIAGGENLGVLHGIPLGVKDLITTAEGETTGQSLALHVAWRESINDAPVVARLRASGGIVVGKTTTMELAIGYPDTTKPFPIPRNPWDLTTWAGGSSSGTATGIATGMFLGGLGTDTGGSIRVPAALNGVSGLKPTFGLVPTAGCVPLGYSLDHIGPMARSSRDCALLLTVLAAPQPRDSDALDFTAAMTGDLTGIRVGLDRLTRFSSASEDPLLADVFEDATRVLRDRGAELVEIELPRYRATAAAAMATVLAEGLAQHTPALIIRWDDFFAATRRTLGMAAYMSAADYVQAQRVRRAAQDALAELFETVDLVATPTVARGASSLSAEPPDFTDVTGSGVHTGYWNAVGNPVLSIPMGFSAPGLPLGLQLAGRPFEDSLVLRAGDAFQRETDWHLRRPPVSEPGGSPINPQAHGAQCGEDRGAQPAHLLLEMAGLRPSAIDDAHLSGLFHQFRGMIGHLYAEPIDPMTPPSLTFRADPHRSPPGPVNQEVPGQ